MNNIPSTWFSGDLSAGREAICAELQHPIAPKMTAVAMIGLDNTLESIRVGLGEHHERLQALDTTLLDLHIIKHQTAVKMFPTVDNEEAWKLVGSTDREKRSRQRINEAIK